MATLRPPKADLFSDEVICAVNPRIRSIPRHFTVQFQTDKSKGDVKSKSPIKPRVIKSKSAITEDHRRERCRQNQARYREKQRVLTLSLQDDISKLQREVWELTLLRSSACVGIPIRQNSWLVVTEYFRIFQLGFTAPTLELQTFVRNFLRKAMALDVTDGTLCGVEAMMEHWTLISMYFADFHVQLKRLESGDDMDTLVATTITSVTITTETLRRVFPHLLVSDAKSLALMLQDRRIVMHGSVHFAWDSTNDCVARMQSQSDMLTPILQLLGNLDSVSRVFDNALVTPDFRLIAKKKI